MSLQRVKGVLLEKSSWLAGLSCTVTMKWTVTSVCPGPGEVRKCQHILSPGSVGTKGNLGRLEVGGRNTAVAKLEQYSRPGAPPPIFGKRDLSIYGVYQVLGGQRSPQVGLGVGLAHHSPERPPLGMHSLYLVTIGPLIHLPGPSPASLHPQGQECDVGAQ